MTVNVLGRRLPATATYAIALAAGLLLLILTVGAALYQVNRTQDLNVAVRESIDTRGHLRLLLRAMLEAETGQRGYLLTGKTDYLEPYSGARDSAMEELDALAAAAEGDAVRSAHVARLRELATRKLDELDQTIALQQRGQPALARGIVLANRGKALMDELRGVLAAAEAREQARVSERMAEVDRGGRQLRLVILLAALLLVGIAALMVVTVRGAMRELRAARDSAEATNLRLIEEMGGREKAEAKVRQMQKMEAIGQLTGGVAHDFNNMLAVIMSALQLAQRRIDRGEAGAGRFIDAAMDGARRAAILTSRLLAFARRQPLTPQVIDVNRVLGGMSEMLRRTLGEQIDFETVLAGGVWKVNADVNELENALVNICVNARDAMPGGGKLTIESANASLDEEYARHNVDVTPGQYVMIAITDTGQGMSPEVRAKAFDPFFTTKDVGKGTGLGLSHVHGFLKQSGGHVAIYSEVGHGTTLKLYLPRTQLAESTAEAPATAGDEIPHGDPGTLVLVVEDEERVRLLSVASLRELGYTVIHADRGAAALDLLDKHPAVTLLFTDIVMPDMSGRKLSDEALRRRPDLKVLYTTGYTQNAIVHNGVVDADARLLMKPYTLADLARKVRAVLTEA
ncbi:CHASE3 domain-containing protein [Terricaulis sp.]|uniref:CHASE3 domain-containing protein n=1 Tax=Terricaulis sp. TaxID=2768686 RepID=UPI003782EE78